MAAASSPVLPALRPVQIAYHVPDPIVAARNAARDFHWGPFFVLEHIPLTRAIYRGKPTKFDHSSAYGQAGGVMVEFITQHGDGSSILRDLYAPDQIGLHHVACFVANLASALAAYRGHGKIVAFEALTAAGVEFAMVDLSTELGHMIELYEPSQTLADFYSFVRRKAEDWDGTEPVRHLR